MKCKKINPYLGLINTCIREKNNLPNYLFVHRFVFLYWINLFIFFIFFFFLLHRMRRSHILHCTYKLIASLGININLLDRSFQLIWPLRIFFDTALKIFGLLTFHHVNSFYSVLTATALWRPRNIPWEVWILYFGHRTKSYVCYQRISSSVDITLNS